MGVRNLFRRSLAVVAAVALALPAAAVAGEHPDPAVVHANKVRSGAIGYREGYFGTGNARLHYVEAGTGPLVILYHGFPSFWFAFFDQMEALKPWYRVVAVDAPGAGRSAKPQDLAPYRIERLADQLDELARHLNGDAPFALVGHDWGAALAFAYAQARPERLTAVVGISAPPYSLFLDLARTSPEQQRRSQYMQVFRTLTLEAITASGTPERIWRQSYGELMRRGDLDAAEAELFRAALADPLAINAGMNWYRANIPPFAAISAADAWPAGAPPIRVPALLLWGGADNVFVADAITRMPAYAADLKTVMLPGVEHWATMERPALASDAIRTFLKARIQPPAP